MGKLTRSNTVWYYHNVPALVPKLDPSQTLDAVYVPRRVHITGDINARFQGSFQ